jgi:hypothetical protein
VNTAARVPVINRNQCRGKERIVPTAGGNLASTAGRAADNAVLLARPPFSDAIHPGKACHQIFKKSLKILKNNNEILEK